ncbi:MAG: hypothetical protein CVU89_04110 [Firmicutes bacterium HGW-Firmicutes-14]|jgi:iron-sulfur cluster repair protein YtfE (RIC family)|nr:MAG: hypothetical protein CVU89_04110 [Firmicutes bacterium HGW-Firmicutes-14]
MDWMKNYHEDHKAVLILLAKLEGNILDLKAGLATPNTFVEFQEFGDVIRNVIIPHFKNEEEDIYVRVSDTGIKGREFIDKMLQEHEALYALFDNYLEAVKKKDTGSLVEVSGTLDQVLRHHIIKEEDDLPEFLE